MNSSRICLGYDDAYIYSISPDNINSYDIQQGITTISRNTALDSTDSFVTCFGHQNQFYIGAVDPIGNTRLHSYRISSTPQHQPQIDIGSPSFDFVSDTDQLNSSTIVSMVPIYQPTFASKDNSNGTVTSSDQNQPCVIISSNNPGQFNGLYKACLQHDTSIQRMPFPFETSTTPLLATNNAHTSIVLLGYPNANSVYVYNKLDDLSKPSTRYHTEVAIPSKGSVQILNDAATEFLIFDYDKKITHIQLETNPTKQTSMAYTYELSEGQQNIGAISLANGQLFTASDKNNGGNGHVFEEIPFDNGLPSKSIQQVDETPVTSTAESPSLSTAVLGGIIGGSVALVMGLLCLGLWLFRRNQRNKQRRTNLQEDDVRSYLNLHDDTDESSSPNGHGNADPERGVETMETNTADRQINPTPASQPPLRHRDTINTTNSNMNNNRNRNASIRRGIDTIIQRMVSLRSPQSPSSIFSLFSNISSTPPPVTDKYRKVKQVNFPSGACELMEPTFFDTNGTLIVNGHYQLLDDQVLSEENSRIPGYATRTIQHATKDESVRTLHYYPANQQNAFLRNINITIRLQESNRIICHYDALSLSSPTRCNYRYYWISGLCMVQQSLHYLLHDQDDHPAIVDTRQFNFMSLTVLSLLSCLRDVHALDCCHLGLSLRSFYYQKVSAITEWYIGRFDQAHVIGQPEGHGIILDIYSAPELVKEATTSVMEAPTTPTTPCLSQQNENAITTIQQYYCYKFSPRPALDCWSLGCVIYEVATGAPLFKDFEQLYQLCSQPFPSLTSHLQRAYDQVELIHPSFRACLENLLQVNPIERSSIDVVLDDWIKTNQLYDDLD